MRRAVGLERFQQLAADLVRDVVQRSQWPGRSERVASAPQYADVTLLRSHEGLDQRSLADPRFAADEYAVAATVPRRRQRAFEQYERFFALEQYHSGPSRRSVISRLLPAASPRCARTRSPRARAPRR